LVKALAAALREERSRVDGVAFLSTADEESVASGEEDRKLGPSVVQSGQANDDSKPSLPRS